MTLLDQLAEQHILAALSRGELDNLPGAGQPLLLDDDSHVPPELRAGYRLLKNSGYLPVELEMRREAVELNELLRSIESHVDGYQYYASQLRNLEIRLEMAGIDTTMLHGGYGALIQRHLAEDK